MRIVLLCLSALLCGCLDLEVARFARLRAGPPAGTPAQPAGVGRSCIGVVVLFPVTGPPSLGKAAAEAARGAPLSDVVVRYELRYLPPFGGRGCYVVEGRPE